MADLKESQPSAQHGRDDLSDAASSILEQQSLKDEELPSYSDQQTGNVPPSNYPSATAEKSALAREQYNYVSSSEPSSHPRPAELSATSSSPRPAAVGPTASQPFNFPISELPAYSETEDIIRPLAIPQITASSQAPFLSAFSPQLLSYGIPAETWYNFLSTLSAFVSANISQQALHHATEIGQQIAEFHKNYAYEVTKKAKRIGDKAMHLQLGGVIGGVVGLATSSVGHVVGTVFNTHRNLWTKPKTPRERATVYIATANRDWFHSRGLHALLLDTQELANVLGIPFQQVMLSINAPGITDPAQQLGALRDYIAEVEVREEEPLVNPGMDGQDSSTNMMSGPSGANFARRESGAQGQRQSSNAAGKKPVVTGQMQVRASTMWLVLTQESKIQAMELEAKKEKSGR